METGSVLELVIPAILRDRRIVYAITDRNCTVLAVSDASWSPHAHLTGGVGQHLVEAVPELVGSEAILADLLAGRLPRSNCRGSTVNSPMAAWLISPSSCYLSIIRQVKLRACSWYCMM